MILFLLGRYQERLIFPGSLYQGAPSTRVKASSANGKVVRLDTGVEELAGLWEPISKHPAEAMTVLYFYGNGSCMGTSGKNAEAFRKCGANVMMVDYPGYGMSGGLPSEAGTIRAREAALKFLKEQGIQPERPVFAGTSLGGAVAIQAAADHPCAGLMTFSTFTNMTEMSEIRLPFVPFRSLVLRHPFRSDEAIAQVECPMLLVHGNADRSVPYAMHARLIEAARKSGQEVVDLTVERGDHNDALEKPETIQAVRRFLERAAKPRHR